MRPRASRKAEYHGVMAFGSTLLVVRPCRNLGASGPDRYIKRRWKSSAMPAGGRDFGGPGRLEYARRDGIVALLLGRQYLIIGLKAL